MTLSVVQIANLALDEIPAASITSLNDNVHRAEVLRRQYPQALGELMEIPWSFAIRRAPLTAITNSRSPFWGYAYQLPNDLGYPLRLMTPEATSLFHGSYGAAIRAEPGLPFDTEGATIWSQQSAVELEYVSRDPAFSDMSASFEKALVMTLAAKIVMPITKDRSRRDDLIRDAEVARERAAAQDANRNAQANRYGDNFIPEAIEAMMGVDNLADTAPVATVAPMAYDGLPDDGDLI